jgi:hypothetical protein
MHYYFMHYRPLQEGYKLTTIRQYGSLLALLLIPEWWRLIRSKENIQTRQCTGMQLHSDI